MVSVAQFSFRWNLDRWIRACESRPWRVLAVLAVLMAAQISPWWYASDDSHSYLSIARSIADGTGPTNLGSRHLWFSPGYPLLISPMFLLGDRPFLGISISQWLLMLAFMVGVYQWSRGVVGRAAIWIAALTVVNHAVWVHYRRPLSELAFTCALVWVANCLRWTTAANRPATFAARLALAASLTAASCVVRPVGIVLGPACVLATCLAARRRALAWPWAAITSIAIVIASAVPVALIAAHDRATAGTQGRTYLDEFHDAAEDLLPNYSKGLQICVSDIGRLCIPGMFKTHGAPGDWTDINMLVHGPFFILLCVGWWHWVRRDDDVLAWCLPFFVALLAAHAIATDARLMLPMLPALLVCFWLAVERIGQRGRRVVAAVALAAQLLVATGYWLWVDAPRAHRNHRRWPAIETIAREITRSPGVVALGPLPDDADLMLELALDRRVSRGGEAGPHARWFVTSRDGNAPSGFERFDEAGGLTLWSRHDDR